MCILKLVVCILLRVLGQVQGFCLTQHCFEYIYIYIYIYLRCICGRHIVTHGH
jgi:hypothetical protein